MMYGSIGATLINQDDDFSHFFALEPEAASINFSYEFDEKKFLD